MDESESVRTHYSTPSLRERVSEALSQAGFDDRPVTWEDLAPLDQFHVRGLPATRELAAELKIPSGARVLDVGCGIGGASRFLAATYGARVTGIDLTPSFIEIAAMLSDRAGLSDRVAYRVADATNLPFADSSFDYAWTQHVAMNIRDRARLYAEIHRVLVPHGRLAIYDIVRGDGEEPVYPVPWAHDPTTSFLLTSDAMRDVLARAGFEELSWRDATDVALAWSAEQAARNERTASSPLSLGILMGADFSVMMKNLKRSLVERRVRLVETIQGRL